MSIFADGIIHLYNYFTNSVDSFAVPTGTSPNQCVTVQADPSDTIESLVQKIRDRVREENTSWKKCWLLPLHPSELEKSFNDAVEWAVAYTKFEKARASMLRGTLSKKYGKEHVYKLGAYINQAICGDAKDKDKPLFGVNDSLWKVHKDLAGMSQEKAMQYAAEELVRQKKMFSNETIVPRHNN